MQHNNFRNLNRVIFTHWKHPEFRVSNAFWYCFSVIKLYTFHYLMKSAPIPGNQSSFKILQLLDIWRYQSLVILFFSSVVILTKDESDGLFLVERDNLVSGRTWLKVEKIVGFYSSLFG